MSAFFDHLKAMGNLEGMATDYPLMFVVYLGIFVACLVTTTMLVFSKHGKRVVWLPEYGALLEPVASVRIEPPKSVRQSH